MAVTVNRQTLIHESFFRLIIDNAAVGIAQVDPTGKLLMVNKKISEITGYSNEELLTKTFYEITHPDDLEADVKKSEALFRGEIDSFSMEKRYIRKDGTIVWAKLNGSAVFDDNGKFNSFIGVIEDITEKKETEEALQNILKHYKIASSAAKIGAYFRNLQTGENYWSPELLSLFGLKPDEPFPMKDGIPRAVHPDDRESVLNLAQRHYDQSNNTEFSSDHRIILPDGTIRWMNVRGITERDFKKDPLKTYGIAMDITERKSIEKELQRKVEENEKLMNVVPAAIWISSDRDCYHVRGNAMANKLFEAEPEENVAAKLISKRTFLRNGVKLNTNELPMELAASENIPILNQIIDVILPGGKMLNIQGSAAPLNDEQGEVRGAIGAFIDITDRVESEKALRESEEKLRILANNMSQLAWMMDKDGWVFWYNQRWYDYTGTTFEEMKGWGWKNVHHPDHIDRVIQNKNRAIETGEVWEELFPLRSKEGKYRWFLTRAVPLKDENGTIIRWLGTNTDVTHQREIENKLKYDNKLFEDLLYISAHDLKGPVANMHGALDLMDSLPMEKKVFFLNRFRDLADQLNITIQGITDILRMRNDDKTAATALNVDRLLNKILAELNYPVHHASIHRNFEKTTINYIEVFLYSILKNILSNALKYRRDDIPLCIDITTHLKKDYTLLTVSDNGVGIDLKKYGDKLFLPFQQIKAEKNKGTGIGLYLIKEIVEKNGGYINIESTPGEGTKFNCYLREY